MWSLQGVLKPDRVSARPVGSARRRTARTGAHVQGRWRDACEEEESADTPIRGAPDSQRTWDHIAFRLLRVKTKENRKSFVGTGFFRRVQGRETPEERRRLTTIAAGSNPSFNSSREGQFQYDIAGAAVWRFAISACHLSYESLRRFRCSSSAVTEIPS